MKVLVVTGMSGAGKSNTLKSLEDAGFYCLDNLPIKLISDVVGMMLQLEDCPNCLAITADARNKSIAEELLEELGKLQTKAEAKLLYLESDNTVLLKRYKETRRLHPLMMHDSKMDLQTAIEEERSLLTAVRQKADYVIDTTYLSSSELRQKLLDVVSTETTNSMYINFVAFGYKYGLPADADVVFDVRCLPNPYYIPEYRSMTGLDKEIRDYVMGHEQSQALLEVIKKYLECAIPMYEKEGKAQLVVGLGCTGGQHRSLTFSILLAEYFESQGYKTAGYSRDMKKNLSDIKQREILKSDGNNFEGI